MRRAYLIWLLVYGTISASAAAGDLWIDCADGITVLLDGEPAGVCGASDHGIRVEGPASGEHTFRFEKAGYVPAEYALSLGSASAQLVVPALLPAVEEGSEELAEGKAGAPPSGSVQITSNPRSCEVDFAGLTVRKEYPVMTYLGVPVGEHELRVDNSGAVLTANVTVNADQTVKAMVDFSSNRVMITSTDSVRSEAEQEAGEAAPEADPECIEYWIQVLRTTDIELIASAQAGLKRLGFPEYRQKLITLEADGALPVYKLRVGPIETKADTKYPLYLVRTAGFTSAWIVPEECQSSPVEVPKQRFKPIH